jgi:hypothetical protein
MPRRTHNAFQRQAPGGANGPVVVMGVSAGGVAALQWRHSVNLRAAWTATADMTLNDLPFPQAAGDGAPP